MVNPNSRLNKILSFAVPILLAILLAGGVTYALGLWQLPSSGQVSNEESTLGDVVNKIRGIQTPELLSLKAGLPYGYKGTPQTYTATTDNVDVKTDFANPNTNENVTDNLEARVYKFTQITDGNADLTKGSTFDEATLNRIVNKTEGSFTLDVYPTYSKEFKGLSFTPGETKTLDVSFTPTEAGYYAVIIAPSSYFESNTGEKSMAFIRVVSTGSQLAQGGASTGNTGKTAGSSTSSASSALPQTGATENVLFTLGALILTATALKIRKVNV
jgi:LPXTG-motif cell wall-anchored protein